MAKNDGKDYEEFVRKVQQSLIDAENLSEIKTIEVKKNKKISDRSGIEREFDLYWEFSLGGSLYKTIIECKDYNSTISIDKIDALIGKLSDLPDIKPIFATRTGYQSGSANKAKQHGISLLIVRETNDSDWVSDDGTPLLRTVQLNMTAITPPGITSFSLGIDGQWLAAQDKYSEEDIKSLLSNYIINNDVYIKDNVINERYSIRDMGWRIKNKTPDMPYGRGSYVESFTDAYFEIESKGASFKISKIEAFYQYNKPIEMQSIIDFAAQILGIVEDYHTGNKRMVFHDGLVKDS